MANCTMQIVRDGIGRVGAAAFVIALAVAGSFAPASAQAPAKKAPAAAPPAAQKGAAAAGAAGSFPERLGQALREDPDGQER